MTASQVKALIVGLVLVCGALVGAEFWDQQDADEPIVAQSAAPASDPGKPDLAKTDPAKPQVSPKVNDAAPAQGAPRQSADLGQAGPAPKSEPSAGGGEPPHFDIVRVEPSGEAVVAGKGDPNAKIQLLASGKVVAEVKADSDGNFVILPPALEPGNHDLTLRQITEGKAAVDSTESVAVSVPEKGGGDVVVALAEPGKPTKLLSGPPTTRRASGAETASRQSDASAASSDTMAAAAPETGMGAPAAAKQATSGLVIRSVELENGNGFYASGVAAPGTRVQIYLNGSHLAAVVAGADGQWSVTIRKGLTGGHYAVRADANGAGEAVTARVEVPFDVPMAMAQAAAPPGSGPEPPLAPNPSDVAGLGPEPASRVAVAPEPSAEVPTPRPDLAAAAKAAGAKAKAAEASDSNAVIDQVETALVIPGDNLWNISRARLGLGKRFTQIYAANVSQIRDPKLIYPGQVFVVPSK